MCNCMLENYDCRKDLEFIAALKQFNMSFLWEAEINRVNEILDVDCQVEARPVIHLFYF